MLQQPTQRSKDLFILVVIRSELSRHRILRNILAYSQHILSNMHYSRRGTEALMELHKHYRTPWVNVVPSREGQTGPEDLTALRVSQCFLLNHNWADTLAQPGVQPEPHNLFLVLVSSSMSHKNATLPDSDFLEISPSLTPTATNFTDDETEAHRRDMFTQRNPSG